MTRANCLGVVINLFTGHSHPSLECCYNAAPSEQPTLAPTHVRSVVSIFSHIQGMNYYVQQYAVLSATAPLHCLWYSCTRLVFMAVLSDTTRCLLINVKLPLSSSYIQINRRRGQQWIKGRAVSTEAGQTCSIIHSIILRALWWLN